eukprot:NODE_3913_length_864_cov_3.245399_g3248_i0.p3 GENE.NODE_3913_length_864_cov_3.245399_g3248_i0~~NODE_3913_length_864_cov_3.245399_g3248_i0.p3  ORF type:complete len:99 (-),score=2.93 NODE_3913_length_864_cov_3.245399_g3248_i0:64-360(-)
MLPSAARTQNGPRTVSQARTASFPSSSLIGSGGSFTLQVLSPPALEVPCPLEAPFSLCLQERSPSALAPGCSRIRTPLPSLRKANCLISSESDDDTKH